MLVRALVSLAVITGAAWAFPASVCDTPAGGGKVQDFKGGTALDIPCPKIEQADGVQVVMYPGRDDTSSGVGGVLVTDNTIETGMVHVRVPDIPDLKDHVVQVKVYYFSIDGRHACNAGRIRLT
jgi:hypothetical protein